MSTIPVHHAPLPLMLKTRDMKLVKFLTSYPVAPMGMVVPHLPVMVETPGAHLWAFWAIVPPLGEERVKP